MITEAPTPPAETGIIEQELTLAGTRAFITGASRDIGAAIAVALARQGVDVLGAYRDPAKKKRADATKRVVEELGGSIDLFISDITTPEGLMIIDEELGEEPLDFLVLSASGPSDDINVTASQNLINLALPKMKEGSVVVLMQSIPGHLAPQLDAPQFSTIEYDETAESKRRGEDVFRSRSVELEKQGIKTIVIAPPIVEGTSNVTRFRWKNKKIDEIHEEVSRKLGVPTNVPIDEVGQKVVELLNRRHELSAGYTELFADLVDTRSSLGKWYDHPRIYVDTAKRLEDTEMKRSGVSRSIVSVEQTERTDEPDSFIDELLQDENGSFYGRFTPQPDHATGHFKDDSGLPRLLAGHKHIRAAIETIQRIQDEGFLSDTNLPLTLIKATNIDFKAPVMADGTRTVNIKPGIISVSTDGTISCSISIQDLEGNEMSSIENLVLAPQEPDAEPTLKPDQLIEAMAQAAGVTGLDMDGSRFPQFKRIAQVLFSGSALPKAGEGMKYQSVVLPASNKGFNHFTSHTVAEADGGPIASLSGAEVMVFPARALSRLK